MFAQTVSDIQKGFFFSLNQFAEPLIRAGFGNPILLPAGTIVVETIGRKTGRRINIPVVTMRFGDLMVFSTVRQNSQWLKNLAAMPNVRYWLAGQPHEATAFLLTPDQKNLPDALPPNAACLARFLHLQSHLLGVSFAILTPRL